MRQSFIHTLIIIVTVFTSIVIAQDENQLSLEDIFFSTKYIPAKIANIQWLPDGSAFTYTATSITENLVDIYEFEIESVASKLLISGRDLKYNNEPIIMSNYSWTEDGNFLLIEGSETKIWRHSRQAPYYMYNINTREIKALGENDPGLRNVKLSPDGQKVGFVRDHNIYITDLNTGVEDALTTDGTENILNGEFDWVYEEEFSIADGWQWSPDGKKIAFWRLDQTRVKEFYIIDEMHVYNIVTPLKYPKTGEQNSIVKIGVVDVFTGETKWMNIGEEEDIYIPRIYWTNSSDKLAILRLNRKQNHVELLMTNTISGESMVTLEDRDSCWIEVRENNIIFLQNKDEIVWVSEKSGYRHAYLYDYEGNLINQITSGNWEITDVLGVSEEDRLLYFSGKKDSPIEQHIYRVKLDGDDLQKITDEPGWHEANFSPDYKYFVNEYSSSSHPSKTKLVKTDGKLVRLLVENDLPELNELNVNYPEFSTLTTSDSIKLNYFMIKPPDFDESKKYPVLVFGYGGPGSQKVINEWGEARQLWHMMMSQKGFIIFCVDNRGTGGRGKAFKNLVYKDLGKWAVNDQIEGAKFLATLPYVDSERIGFWGWSGGGYLCLMLMTRANEYFSTGVSVAPVTDFHLYDAIWTERYMGMLSENVEGYKSASVLTYANNLEGNLLIVHGTGDDNVHYQNTMQIVREFQLAGKQFDLMLYPNKNHSISGGNTSLHVYTLIAEYFMDNL
ncbi:MAG: S9 family peptidase [Ignavibacteriaceae bacterium]